MIKAKWNDWFGKTTEELALLDGQGRIEAQSIVRGTNPDFTCQYRLKCSESWIFREVEIQTSDNKKLFLSHDGSGNWRDTLNKPLEHLQGAMEIDFVLTPFTNTLPIKRLNLERGESAEITTAWIDVDLSVKPDAQRYTCLEPMRLYRFESISNDFTQDIEVDENGLVTNYPELFRRV